MTSASETRHILRSMSGETEPPSVEAWQPSAKVVGAELKLERALRLIREARDLNPVAAADRHREAGRVARRAAHVLMETA